ncbi:hypothetical protein IWX50DRAFT_682071 [Phyllosticta citricarpa]|uniref:Uncharacterized protein n=1 Tax=Phyllosticta citricarpa TaxID=55181 RepID=A0ABR1LBZ2_9PEZI
MATDPPSIPPNPTLTCSRVQPTHHEPFQVPNASHHRLRDPHWSLSTHTCAPGDVGQRIFKQSNDMRATTMTTYIWVDPSKRLINHHQAWFPRIIPNTNHLLNTLFALCASFGLEMDLETERPEDQKRSLQQAHELVAVYDLRLPEGFVMFDRSHYVPHIVSMLAVLDPQGCRRSAHYDPDTPQAHNLRVPARRAAAARRKLGLMVAAKGSWDGFDQLVHSDRDGGYAAAAAAGVGGGWVSFLASSSCLYGSSMAAGRLPESKSRTNAKGCGT